MRLRHRVEYAAFVAGSWLVRALPERTALRLARQVGRLWFARGGKHVRYALANLRVALPGRDEAERRAIARRSYECLAENAIEVIRAADLDDAELLRRVTFRGLEHVHKALEDGRGVLALTLHLGNFELAIKTAPLCGVPAVAVARPLGNPLLYDHLARNRTSTGAELIDRRRAAAGILRALRRNRVVGILNDQYSRRTRGVFAPLFGARCSTSAGLATLARRSGAAVLPFYAVRVGPGRHEARFLPPLDLATAEGEDPVVALTTRFNAVLEGFIREHPEQWMWAHRRFRHSPDLPDLRYG